MALTERIADLCAQVETLSATAAASGGGSATALAGGASAAPPALVLPGQRRPSSSHASSHAAAAASASMAAVFGGDGAREFADALADAEEQVRTSCHAHSEIGGECLVASIRVLLFFSIALLCAQAWTAAKHLSLPKSALPDLTPLASSSSSSASPTPDEQWDVYSARVRRLARYVEAVHTRGVAPLQDELQTARDTQRRLHEALTVSAQQV